MRKFVLLTVACAASTAFADNVMAPWGAVNGDIQGRSRSATIPTNIVDNGFVEAWSADLGALGLNRPAGLSSFVYDAAGNIYIRTSTPSNTLAKFDTDGNLLWTANDGADNQISFGPGFTCTSPIVGDGDFAYVMGEGDGAPAEIAAVRKDTGLVVWVSALDDPAASCNNPTPVLYESKLYVLGGLNGGAHTFYQIDSATGNIDWSSSVAITLSDDGNLTMAPDLFGAGIHGVFCNFDSGAGDDGVGEVYCIRADTNTDTATLEWSADGGKIARSHVIYNPDAPNSAGAGRIYTHTWADYGASFYAYNPITGAPEGTATSNLGQGFYDVGCLGFNNTDIFVGAAGGLVGKYTDNGDGTISFVTFAFGETWWGEFRLHGQLLNRDNGDMLLVAGTRSSPIDQEPVGEELAARAVSLDVSNAVIAEDGPIWIDNLTVMEGPDTNNLTTIFSENFEGMTLGDLTGQNGWEEDNEPADSLDPRYPGAPQVVLDPEDPDNQVMRLDALGNGGDPNWNGAFHDFPDSTADTVVIQWSQFRETLQDNVWPYFGGGINNFDEGWTLEWDATLAIFPYHFANPTGNEALALDTGLWQRVTITYEFINDLDPSFRLVTVTVADSNGSVTGFPALQTDGFNATDAIRGWGVQYEGTPPVGVEFSNPAVSEYDSGELDPNFNLRGGVMAGPDGKVYYARVGNNTLYALGADGPPCGDCADSNCDGSVTVGDINFFVAAVTGGEAAWNALFPGGSAPCDYLCANDTNASGDVSVGDINDFVTAVTSGSPCAPE